MIPSQEEGMRVASHEDHALPQLRIHRVTEGSCLLVMRQAETADFTVQTLERICWVGRHAL